MLVLLGLGLHAQTTGYHATAQVQKGDLAVRVDDYVAMPLPSSLIGRLSRVSVMRFEPGDAPQFASRTFVADLSRHLYVFDLNTRTFTSYINFEAVFARFVNGTSHGAGLGSFTFHPEYARNGKLYTVHTENPALAGSTIPSNEFLPGLNLSGGYTPTDSIDPPEGTVARHAVLVEWIDNDLTNTTFEGTAREVLRIGFTNGNHSIGDMLFNPVAQPGDPDFANLYVALGDGGAGHRDRQDSTIPQRLDALPGKILRITPDVDRRPADLLAANGRYRIPSTGVDANPFVDLDLADAKPEIFAYGLRNPQRMSWDVLSNTFLVADIGLDAWEELNVVRRGANYGYSEREGPEQLFIGGADDGKTGSQTLPPTPHPEPDTLTVAGLAAPVTPRYPAAAFSHRDGDAIAGGFVYRGTLLPELYGKYVFADIPTARLFYVDLGELRAADDDDPATLAPIRELQVLFDDPADTPDRGLVPARLFDVIADQYERRGGETGHDARLPQPDGHLSDGVDTYGVPYGGGRADIRFAEDRQGELFILSKSDGMIRRLVAISTGATSTVLSSSPNPSEVGDTVHVTAFVTAERGVPLGSVDFFDGSTFAGTAPLVSGTATITLSGLAAGAHLVTGRFIPGNEVFLESVGGVMLSVGQPDLVSAVTLTVRAVAPGTQLTFTESTSNIGPASAAASTTQYFLSPDPTTAGGIAIGTRSVVALGAGVESAGTPSRTIPSTTALGTYYVIACADGAGTIAERREDNNCSPSTTTVDVTRPDLVTTAVTTAAAAVAPGGALTVSDTVQNQGGITSASSATRFYFSADAVKSADDRLLTGSRAVTALAAGVSSAKAGTKLTIPSSVPLGFYTLIACADDTAKNVELSEANNCAVAAGQVQVGRPDLVVATLSEPPPEIAPARKFPVTAATKNQGTASSLSSKTAFYLSADRIKDAADVLLTGAISVVPLTPGQTISSSQTITVPAVTANGTYHLLACADDTRASLELDEGNNCTAAAATVQVKRADLTEREVSDPPATVLTGGTFSVTDTVFNGGEIASGSTTTRYYLSLDATKTPGDVVLAGTRSVPSLIPGASSTGSRTVSVPALSPGRYYLLACADDTALASELREDNNCLASSATTVVP